jgi:transposase-like protein
MSDFDCPYCGREYEADYDETISANFSRTCTECHKEFKVEVEVHVLEKLAEMVSS